VLRVADGWVVGALSLGATPPPATESGPPLVEADWSGLLGPGPAGEVVGSSRGPDSLICSGDRAMLGTRYRDPTPSAHTPKTIIRLIVAACIRSFYGPG